MSSRGYLWEHLREDVEAEFAQEHPLAQLSDSMPEKSGWHVEGALGDMSGIRRSEKRRRGEKSTVSVRELRERRRVGGLCIECGLLRDPRSKNYCAACREKDRLRAKRKRATMREKVHTDERPDTTGLTHKFKVVYRKDDGTVEEVKGYITTGLYPDGRVGEVFLKVGKSGDTNSIYDQWAINFSMSLQHGVPLEDLCRKFVGQRFEPSGRTENKQIPACTSIVDYVARWLLIRYGSAEAREAMLTLAHESQGVG